MTFDDPTSTTTELVQRAVAGDPAAWEQLVRRYEPGVTALVRSYRLQEADVHDAVQRTWLLMIEHSHRVRDPEALVGWLRTTARRECLRILRDQGRVDPVPDAGANRPDPASDVERHVVEAETATRLRALVRVLPARSRALIGHLFSDEPGSYADLSRNTGIPVGSIGPTRARALDRLRHSLERDAQPPSRELRRTALA